MKVIPETPVNFIYTFIVQTQWDRHDRQNHKTNLFSPNLINILMDFCQLVEPLVVDTLAILRGLLSTS
jgi:hypothetical protein